MDNPELLKLLVNLSTELGTVLVAIWWLTRRMDRLEEKFDAKLNNGIGGRINRVEEKVNRIEGVLSVKD